MKTCSKCKIEKPVSLEYFSKHKLTKDGFDSWCKKCRTKKNKINNSKYKHLRTTNHMREYISKGKGVYGLFENGKCLYVGQSRGINGRWKNHRYLIKHPDKTSVPLYQHLSKHNHIVFGIIEQCDNHVEQEQYFINKYKPLYNEK